MSMIKSIIEVGAFKHNDTHGEGGGWLVLKPLCDLPVFRTIKP